MIRKHLLKKVNLGNSWKNTLNGIYFKSIFGVFEEFSQVVFC